MRIFETLRCFVTLGPFLTNGGSCLRHQAHKAAEAGRYAEASPEAGGVPYLDVS